jgi:hypothetical protein
MMDLAGHVVRAGHESAELRTAMHASQDTHMPRRSPQPTPERRPQAPPQSDFGRELQRLREERELSRLQAARRSGLNDAYWGQLERGSVWRRQAKHPDGGVWDSVQNPGVGTITQIYLGLRLNRSDAVRLFTLAKVDIPPYLKNYAGTSGPTPRPPASGGPYDSLSDEALAALQRFVTTELEARGRGQHDRGHQHGIADEPADGQEEDRGSGT